MVSRSGDHPNWQDHLEQSAAGCQLLTFVNKAREWWSETTDVVFLNSPWLRRSTGRGFRCLWISFHVLLWCLGVTNFGNFHQMKIPGFQVVEWVSFVFMFLAFAKVFFSSLITSRETFSNSFLLGLASMLSFAFWDYFGCTPPDLLMPGQNTFMTGFLAYTFPILCHCNVHPIVLILIFVHTIGFSLKRFQELEAFVGDAFFLLHISSFQFCMIFAFTLDFTNRVRAVATGILHNADGCNPLDSPVAGRSARGFCWLACILNWIFVAMFCWISSGLGVYPSSIFLLDTICLCLPWMVLCLCHPESTPFKSDFAFVCLSYTPPFWVLIRPILDKKLADESYPKAFDAHIVWFLGGISLAGTSTAFATQSAIQAGCLPILCLLGVLFVMTTFVATILIYCDVCLEIVYDFGYEIPLLLALVT